MTEHDNLDHRLTRWFEAETLEPAPAARLRQTIEATRSRRPRSAAVAGFGSAWAETGPWARIPSAWRTVGVIALIVLALVAGALLAGGPRPPLPAVVGPVGNGLIAYASGGDIFVGDPVTGQTVAIVSGPEVDSSPKFSPDGSRIAFVRGDPFGEEASIIVVAADGSDERVAMPAGFSIRGVGYTWTPDGASLVANLDSGSARTPYFDGELALLDASGLAEPRLLTPPLPRWPGTSWFSPNADVAPMFRPPNGDSILSGNYDALNVFDADLGNVEQLAGDALAPFEPYWVRWPAWSPDGSKIAFGLDRASGNSTIGQIGSFVMNADGSDVRRVGSDLGSGTWSPDGTAIAFERWDADPTSSGAMIVIFDLASGEERVLGATSVDTKVEGNVPSDLNFHGVSSPTGRKWDYEGWSWSPDSRGILMLERYGMRPMVVDVETGRAAELPWSADSPASWQRVAP